MKCSRCQHENEAGAKFCEECATPLARKCANCGRDRDGDAGMRRAAVSSTGAHDSPLQRSGARIRSPRAAERRVMGTERGVPALAALTSSWSPNGSEVEAHE